MRTLLVRAFATALLCLCLTPQVQAQALVPPGYQLVNQTLVGRSFTTHKRGVKSLQRLLQQTLADLTQFFGSAPQVVQAAADQRGSGVATFTLNYGGEPVKGVLFGKLDRTGGSVAVIAARANASASDWRQLYVAPAPAPNKSAPASGGPQTQQFADGTGSISLPTGWQTNLSTCKNGVVVQGPGDQRILLRVPVTVNLPNSSGAQLARQYGGIVAPFLPPRDLLEAIGPQLSQLAVRNRAPTFTLDDVKLVKNDTPSGAVQSALLRYGVSESGKHYRVEAQVQAAPPAGTGFFLFYFMAALRAPDATFERDLPLMRKIAASFQVNEAAAARAIQDDTAARQHQFNALQRQQKANSDAFFSSLHAQQAASDARVAAVQRSSEASLRAADSFDEVIRGVRTVEDTRTGERRSVDLGNVDDIVDSLNQADPGRYRQIPLADEVRGE